MGAKDCSLYLSHIFNYIHISHRSKWTQYLALFDISLFKKKGEHKLGFLPISLNSCHQRQSCVNSCPSYAQKLLLGYLGLPKAPGATCQD
jgi:NAD-dependent dihydropyrimidine dehydrogenase PreA subunit